MTQPVMLEVGHWWRKDWETSENWELGMWSGTVKILRWNIEIYAVNPHLSFSGHFRLFGSHIIPQRVGRFSKTTYVLKGSPSNGNEVDII